MTDPDVLVAARCIERMERSPDSKQVGLEMTLELIREVRVLPGVNGIYMMGIGWEKILP